MDSVAANEEQRADPAHTILRFGDCRLDRAARALWRGDEEVALSPRVYALLEHLVGHPGEALPREEILDAVWGGVIVSDHSLTEAVSRLRQALGDDSRSPRYIQTIPAFGLRFVAAVEEVPREAPEAQSGASTQWPPLWKMALPGATLSGIMIAIGLAAGYLPAALRPAERVALREITLPDGSPLVDAAAVISPDERWIVYTRDDPPRVEVMDIGSGEVRALGPITRLWNARSFYWSPDSTIVARSARPLGGGDGLIELFDIEAGTRETLLDLPGEIGWVWGWQPDGERLLVYHGDPTPSGWMSPRLARVTRAGEVEREWAAGEARGNAGRVSPDGRWLAIAVSGEAGGEIVVVPIGDIWSGSGLPDDHFVDWQNGARLVDPPCADDPPFWNPASDALVFFTFRSGDRDLWHVRLENGVPAGGPEPMSVPGSPYVVQGWLADGRVMFCSLWSHKNLAVAEIDVDSTSLVGEPRFVSRWEGRAINPTWDADGERIMFQSNHDDPRGDLYVTTIPGPPGAPGTIQRFEVEPPRPRTPAWASATDTVFYISPLPTPDDVDWWAGQAIWAQNLETGERERVLPEFTFFGNTRLAIDRSGARLVFNVPPVPDSWDLDPAAESLEPGTYLYDTRGQELTLVSGDYPQSGVSISPDGRRVALVGRDDDAYLPDRAKDVVIIDLEDGASRTIARAPDGWDVTGSLSFSADGRTLGYVISDPIPVSMCGAGQFWLVDLDGGTPRKVDAFDALNPNAVRFSPVADRVVVEVYDCDSASRLYEPR